uniref:Uncharacterized protein n=1 Tax=Oncorhynchus kisutch TaxID=8019 RepID=A0A8C7KBH6_ONCKI
MNIRPLQPTTSDTAKGAVGVFTYEMFSPSKKKHTEIIAVVFSVPYDYNWYSNWFAVGVFNRDKGCDDPLYDEMYNSGQRKCQARSSKWLQYHVTIKASTSNSGCAVVKVLHNAPQAGTACTPKI